MRGKTIVQTAKQHGIPGLALLARYYAHRATTRAPGPMRHACPLCGWTGPRFDPFLVMPQYLRAGAACPRCGALERHRALGVLLQEVIVEQFQLGARRLDVLHLTPEGALAPLIEPHARRYDRSQYEPTPGFLTVDLCNTKLPDASYDLIVANGILSCVEDVGAALAEVQRILRPGGVYLAHEHVTLTGPTVELAQWKPGDAMRPAGLRRILGFGDLRTPGLRIEYIDIATRFSAAETQRYGLIAKQGPGALGALVITKAAERASPVAPE